MIRKSSLTGGLALLLSHTVMYAQDNPIVPDRPGFSTGTYTVKPGWFNVESGYQYAFNNNGTNYTTQTVPLLSLRIGVSPKAELNLLWDGWNIQDDDNQPSDTSVSDLSVGGKYRLYESEQYNITALGLISLPVGSKLSTSNNVDPLLGFLWDYSLSSNVSLFGVIQGSSFKSEGDRVYDIQPAIGASFSHTEKLGTFIEYYSIIPFDSQLNTQSVIDAGMTYLFNKDTQLDVNFGFGLNNASDNFVGFGIARQFSP